MKEGIRALIENLDTSRDKIAEKAIAARKH